MQPCRIHSKSRSVAGRARALLLGSLAMTLSMGVSPGVARAARRWGPRETIPFALAPLSYRYEQGVPLQPNGLAMIFAQEEPFSSEIELAIRPPGGPLGAPQQLPASLGQGGSSGTPRSPEVAFDAVGNALILNPATASVAYRPTGTSSAVQSPREYMSSPFHPSSVAMAPGGEAMFLGTNGGGEAAVAFRPAGPTARIDTANLQTFSEVTQEIGIALDPEGGAVVVLEGPEGGLEQAVRPPGQSSFESPTYLHYGEPGNAPAHVEMATDPSGNAVLAWTASTAGYEDNQVVAAYRAPGKGFNPPQILYEAGERSHEVEEVHPGVTASGDGLVAWSETTSLPECGSGPGVHIAEGAAAMATEHDGAWTKGTPIGPGSYPFTSAAGQVASGGDTIAIGVVILEGGESRCSSTDDSSREELMTATSGKEGLELQPAAVSTGSCPVGGCGLGEIGVSASGDVVVLGAEEAGGSPHVEHWLQAFEEPPSSPGTGAPPSEGAPPGEGAPQGHVRPIVPRKLVAPVPFLRGKPEVFVACPPEAADECAVHISVYTRFGVLPGHRGGKSSSVAMSSRAAGHRSKRRHRGKHRAGLLGRGAARVPAGQRRRVKLRLDKVGRRLVGIARRRHRATPMRLVVTISSGAQTGRSVLEVKLRPPKQGKRKHKRSAKRRH